MADEVHDVNDITAPTLPPSDGARKYACKICRHVVFTSDELLDHEPQQQQIAMRKVRPVALLQCVFLLPFIIQALVSAL